MSFCHISESGDKFTVEVEQVQSQVRDSCMAHFDTLWHKANGRPDSVALESNCARCRQDVWAQRTGSRRRDVRLEQSGRESGSGLAVWTQWDQSLQIAAYVNKARSVREARVVWATTAEPGKGWRRRRRRRSKPGTLPRRKCSKIAHELEDTS